MTDPSRLIVLITGATSGFGEAAARRFVGAGARVIVTGRRQDRLDQLVEQLGDRATPLCFDVGDRAACASALESLAPPFADVDVLVNNAGLALGLEPADRADLDEWDTMIRTNCSGLVTMTRLVLPGMVERGRGHVINVSSVAANWAYPGSNVYGATKAFVTQFSLNLRCDLHGKNIRVTDVEPGLCKTEFSLVRFRGDQAKADSPYADIRYLSAEDIAETIFWSATLPEHVNINRLEVMPVGQSWGPFALHRDDA
jgi:3-hydroxy acid dehydrogenase / malonic semialdehyde reductase